MTIQIKKSRDKLIDKKGPNRVKYKKAGQRLKLKTQKKCKTKIFILAPTPLKKGMIQVPSS